MTRPDYQPPALPAFDRSGFLDIRSLAECVLCDARSPWWFGDMPSTWPANHQRDEHPNTPGPVLFRIWRVVRHGAHLQHERLTRVPPAAPGPEPAAFTLAQCRTCGQSTTWIAADAAAEPLTRWTRNHQRTVHPKTTAPVDHWHLTRTSADHETSTPVNPTLPPRAPGLGDLRALLAGMTEHNDAWENDLAGYRTADGQDIREQALPDYEECKDAHGWQLVEVLPDWISILTAALDALDTR